MTIDRSTPWRPWSAVFLLASLASVRAAADDEPILLWPQGAPGAVGEEDRDRPTLRVYLPEQASATGAAVVICPGGGYAVLATDHEGHQVAKYFQRIGVAGFVLKYRLGPRYHHPVPLQDAQRALRFVRANAEKYGVSPKRVGIMGFSAGGHLASTAATHFDAGKSDADDPLDRLSCRPDFAILGYPVISFTADFAHRGSARNLLGEDPDAQLLDALSNEKQVTSQTPPTFMFHTSEDTGVPPANSLAFYSALQKANVPAELHIYQFGPHGVGLAPGEPAVSTWKDRLADWLKTSGFLADVKRAAVTGTITLNDQPLRWGTISFTPVDSSRAPVAWAMVSGGKFSVPAVRGAVVGSCRVTIQNLGAVEPHPTIPDSEIIQENLPVDILDGTNQLDFKVKRN